MPVAATDPERRPRCSDTWPAVAVQGVPSACDRQQRCAGFYCADTVSLSFGALSVNDVVAAAVTVAFCEVVSYVYYQARTRMPPPSCVLAECYA